MVVTPAYTHIPRYSMPPSEENLVTDVNRWI